MKTSELRIGNLVDVINRSHEVHLPMNCLFKIVEIRLFEVIGVFQGEDIQESSHTIKIGDICGIRLNPKLLKIAHFKESTVKGEYYHDDTFLRIVEVDTGAYYNVCTDEQLLGKKFKYLHQLQNIFTSLYQEELDLGAQTSLLPPSPSSLQNS